MGIDYGPGLSKSEGANSVKKVKEIDAFEEIEESDLKDSTDETKSEDWEEKQTNSKEDWSDTKQRKEFIEILKDKYKNDIEDDDEEYKGFRPGGAAGVIVGLLIVLVMIAVFSIVIDNVLSITGLSTGLFGTGDLLLSVGFIVVLISTAMVAMSMLTGR